MLLTIESELPELVFYSICMRAFFLALAKPFDPRALPSAALSKHISADLTSRAQNSAQKQENGLERGCATKAPLSMGASSYSPIE